MILSGARDLVRSSGKLLQVQHVDTASGDDSGVGTPCQLNFSSQLCQLAGADHISCCVDLSMRGSSIANCTTQTLRLLGGPANVLMQARSYVILP